jgi:RHS repeat-associated protein
VEVEKEYYRLGATLVGYLDRCQSTPTRVWAALDHLGTPRLTVTENGAVTEEKYLPYGEILLRDGDGDRRSLRFTGHERDTESELDYMHARYYNSAVGRFLSTDPFTDQKQAILNPQMWNRFSYAANNPLRFTDPTGKLIFMMGGTAAERLKAFKVLQSLVKDPSARKALVMGSDGRVTLKGMTGPEFAKAGVSEKNLAQMILNQTAAVGLAVSNEAYVHDQGGGYMTGLPERRIGVAVVAEDIDPAGGVAQTPQTAAAHELLGHGHAFMFGGIGPARGDVRFNDRGYAEGNAMTTENEFREENGLPLRQFYFNWNDYVCPE